MDGSSLVKLMLRGIKKKRSKPQMTKQMKTATVTQIQLKRKKFNHSNDKKAKKTYVLRGRKRLSSIGINATSFFSSSKIARL